MKSRKTFLFLLCTAAMLGASAQKELPHIKEQDYNKPRLFADLPEKLEVPNDVLEDVVTYSIGDAVNLPLHGNARFKGTIVSKSDPADKKVQSVVVKSTNRGNSVLTITKTIDESGAAIFLGRIVSLNNSDTYKLVREGTKYQLIKQHLFDTISE